VDHNPISLANSFCTRTPLPRARLTASSILDKVAASHPFGMGGRHRWNANGSAGRRWCLLTLLLAQNAAHRITRQLQQPADLAQALALRLQ
jgi:hypothetical protein